MDPEAATQQLLPHQRLAAVSKGAQAHSPGSSGNRGPGKRPPPPACSLEAARGETKWRQQMTQPLSDGPDHRAQYLFRELKAAPHMAAAAMVKLARRPQKASERLDNR